jgi:hypothetical protein
MHGLLAHDDPVRVLGFFLGRDTKFFFAANRLCPRSWLVGIRRFCFCTCFVCGFAFSSHGPISAKIIV